MNEDSGFEHTASVQDEANVENPGFTDLQDVEMTSPEGREDELRALLAHQIDFEIALRKRIAKVVEARIRWAERLKSSLERGAGAQTLVDPAAFKQQALEEFRAAHAPLDLDPHTAHPRGSLALLSIQDALELAPVPSSSSTSKQLYLIPPTSDSTPFPPLLLLTCPYPSCPTPHPSTTLQGLLNHARIAHGPGYTFNSHDEFISSPGSTNLLDAQLEPERYARVRSEGVRVSLGGVRGLRALFENGVGVGLGLSKETPALAKLLGREVRKGEIRAIGQDEEVDVETVQGEGEQRWKNYGIWATKRRQRRKEEVGGDVESDLSPPPSLPLARDEARSSAEHVQSSSRFYVKKRVVVSDWSQSLRRSQIQPDGPTHRWMIRLTAPSYSDHVTTFISAIRVSCVSVPPLFEGTITCSAPPFVISRLGNAPFLARVTLVFADERTKDVSVTQWVDLDPMRSGRPMLGAEQIFDVELDRNAQALPVDNSSDNIPNAVLWAEDRGATQDGMTWPLHSTTEPMPDVVKSEIQTISDVIEESTASNETVAETYVMEPLHERLIPILSKLRSRLPLTMEDSKGEDCSQVAYTCFPTRGELLESPHGRRKAVEWQYARTMLKMLVAEYMIYDADLGPRVIESLNAAQLHAYLTMETAFPQPELQVPVVKLEEEVEDISFSPVVNPVHAPSNYCGVCGLNILAHHPTAYSVGTSGFACSLLGPYYRPICDVGLWTTLRPVRSAIQRINPIHGLITTLGARGSLRGASQLVECVSPQMTLSVHALTTIWSLKTFGYSAKRRNVAIGLDSLSVYENRFPLELLGVDASHVDRTLSPHALLALVAEIFIKRLVREALRARAETLKDVVGTTGPTVLTTTHISRALMDGRGSEGWLPLMAVARIGALHTDAV